MPTFMVFKDGKRINELVGTNSLALRVCSVVDFGHFRIPSDKKLTEPNQQVSLVAYDSIVALFRCCIE